jgi:hypothetical protein
MVECK